jgi:hypothetical protein
MKTRKSDEFKYDGYYFACATLSRNAGDWEVVRGEFTGRSCSESATIDGTRCLVFKTSFGYAAVSCVNRGDVKAL